MDGGKNSSDCALDDGGVSAPLILSVQQITQPCFVSYELLAQLFECFVDAGNGFFLLIEAAVRLGGNAG